MGGVQSVVGRLHETAAAKKTLVGDLFDVSGLDKEGRAIVEIAVDHCKFDWSRLLPGLKREGATSIPVAWEALGKQTNATAWILASMRGSNKHPRHGVAEHAHEGRDSRATRTMVSLNEDLRDSVVTASDVKTAAIFVGEAAHLVDALLLSQGQRKAIGVLLGMSPNWSGQMRDWFVGDYWQQPGEAFMAGFTFAYSDLRPTSDMLGFTKNATPEIGRQIAGIIG